MTGVDNQRMRPQTALMALGLLLCALAGPGLGAGGSPDWPQARSDVKPDPAVRFGRLSNGMRYAIMKNATPLGQVSLRLRVGSGSLEESDAQQGLAHFLEHMAFRGSKSVPDGEVKKSLERLGLQMGADTNAFTAQTETVYKFDLAKNDETSINRGLMLMRETASELTLDPKLFDIERGVVLSELRLQDNPTHHSSDEFMRFALPHQLASQRFPIGKKALLEAADAPLMRDYYRKWYRPERTTLIVTGDVDIAAIEAKIQARFSGWKAASPPPHDPDLGRPAVRSAEAHVFTEQGAPSVAEIAWVTPFDDSVDSSARERRELIRQVGLAVLNRRLQVAAAAADRKFTQAGAGHAPAAHSAELTTLYVNYEADAWRPALLAAEALRRQAVEGGVQQEEVDREIDAMRTAFKSAAAGADTRSTPSLADALVYNVDADGVFTSPAQDVVATEAVFKGLSAATVTEALRAAFAGVSPVAFVSNPNPIADGDALALAALNEAEHATVVAAAAVQKEVWPYTSFGAVGKVLERRHIDDLDLTEVRFENGVRLNIKPTKFRADQVLVHVAISGGRALLPTDRSSFEWANGALVLGGTGKLDYQTMQRVLAGKTYRVSFATGESTFSFSGETTPADLSTQLQVLTAYVTDPGFRSEAFEQVRSMALRQLNQFATVPMNVMQLNLPSLLHNSDARWSVPTPATVMAAQAEELEGLVAPALAHNSIEITIAGNVTVEQAIDQVAATFGAIAARADVPVRAAEGVRFPAAVSAPVILPHHGAAEQGVAAVAWPTTDVFADMRMSAVRELLADIMTARLFDSVRASFGASYSTQAIGQASTTFRGYGYLLALADVPPPKSSLFYDSIAKIAQDLKATPVSTDELDRARNPAITKLEQARQTNGYWIGALSEAQLEPRFLDLARQSLERLKAVTPADIQQAANTYLLDDTEWKLLVKAPDTP